MNQRPVSTTLLTALLLWGLWLWRRHKLLGVSPAPDSGAAGIAPLDSPSYPPGHVPVLPQVPGTPGPPLIGAGGPLP